MGQNSFQAWDQVQVTAGDYEGHAGVVNGCKEGVATVKLDTVEAPVEIDTDNLKLLGR